jgi:hypothetical protein
MRVQCTVVVVFDLGVKVFTISGVARQVGRSNGRGSSAFGKATEALENFGMSGSVLNAPEHLVVLSLVFCTTEGFFPLESV